MATTLTSMTIGAKRRKPLKTTRIAPVVHPDSNCDQLDNSEEVIEVKKEMRLPAAPSTHPVSESHPIPVPIISTTTVLTSAPDNSYTCPLCSETLRTQKLFTAHIRGHNDVKPHNDPNDPTGQAKVYYCCLCGKMLSSFSSLDRHMLVHSGERPFSCQLCGQTFTTNGNMHRHKRTHSAKELMELKEALARAEREKGSTSSKRSSRKRKNNEKSLKTNDATQPPKLPTTTTTTTTSLNPFPLLPTPLPTVPFPPDLALRETRLPTLPKTPLPPNPDLATLRLPTQPPLASQVGLPAVPMAVADGMTTSSVAMTTSVPLAMSEVPEPRVPLDVESVLERAKERAELLLASSKEDLEATDISSLGDDKDPQIKDMKLKGEFPCRLCPAIYPNLRALKGHNKEHLSKPPYRCNVGKCAFWSNDKSRVIQHMRLHTGEKPYECKLCNYGFTTKANCERHLKNKHGKSARDDIRNSLVIHENAEEHQMALATKPPRSSTTTTLTTPSRPPSATATLESESIKGFRCKVCKIVMTSSASVIAHGLKEHPAYSKDVDHIFEELLPTTCVTTETALNNEIGDLGGPSMVVRAPSLVNVALNHLDMKKGYVTTDGPLDLSRKNINNNNNNNNNNYNNKMSPGHEESSIYSKSEEPITMVERGGKGAVLGPTSTPNELLLRHLANTSNFFSPILMPFNPKSSSSASLPFPFPPLLGLIPGLGQPPTPTRQTAARQTAALSSRKPSAMGGESREHLRANGESVQRASSANDIESPLSAQQPIISEANSKLNLSNDRLRNGAETEMQVRLTQASLETGADENGEEEEAHMEREEGSTYNDNNNKEMEMAEDSLEDDTASCEILAEVVEPVDNESDESDGLSSITSLIQVATGNVVPGFGSASAGGKMSEMSEEEEEELDADEKRSGREVRMSAYSAAPHTIACPYCPRKFPWQSSLNRHILTHTGDKPFKCAFCPLLFTTKSNCDRHQARKHKGRNNDHQIGPHNNNNDHHSNNDDDDDDDDDEDDDNEDDDDEDEDEDAEDDHNDHNDHAPLHRSDHAPLPVDRAPTSSGVTCSSEEEEEEESLETSETEKSVEPVPRVVRKKRPGLMDTIAKLSSAQKSVQLQVK